MKTQQFILNLIIFNKFLPGMSMFQSFILKWEKYLKIDLERYSMSEQRSGHMQTCISSFSIFFMFLHSF